MPILLCKTADNSVPNSPGKWLAGEIVTAVADDHVFSPIEQAGAGAFHHIKVLGATLEQVQAYLQDWKHEPTTAIDVNNGSGGFRLTITSTMVSASGKNAITRAQMDNFVTKWGGTYVSHTNTTYTFDISVFSAGTSEGMFGVDPSAVTFVDEGFAGGVQQIGITDFGPFTPGQVAGAVNGLGGTIIDSDSYTLPAATVYDAFKDDIEESWRALAFKRRRWYTTQAARDYLNANGGYFEGTAAQILPYLRDGLLD